MKLEPTITPSRIGIRLQPGLDQKVVVGAIDITVDRYRPVGIERLDNFIVGAVLGIHHRFPVIRDRDGHHGMALSVIAMLSGVHADSAATVFPTFRVPKNFYIIARQLVTLSADV